MLFNTPISVGYGNGVGTPAGLPVRDRHPHASSPSATSPWRARSPPPAVSTASSATASAGSSAWRPALRWPLPTRCSRRRFAAASRTSRAPSWRSTATTSRGTGPALFMVALIAVLAFFDVHISARVLGVALIGEVIVLLIFDAVVFGAGRREHPDGGDQPGQRVQEPAGRQHRRRPTSPPVRGRSACSSRSGRGWASRWRRTTARSRRDPKRIVPRAMYISVVGLGIFYTITSWAAISGYASTAAAAVQAQTNAVRVLPPSGRRSSETSC